MFQFACGGWDLCRRVAGRLTEYVLTCKDMRHYIELERGKVSVHTDAVWAMGGAAEMRTFQCVLFFCTS